MSGQAEPAAAGDGIGASHFRALAQTASCLTILLDDSGRVLEAMDADRPGVGPSFLSEEWIEAFAVEDRPRVRKLLGQARGGDDPRRMPARLWSHRRRGFLDVEVAVIAVARLGGPPHVLVSAVDLTAARAAQEEHQRKLAEKDAVVREHKVRLRELSHRVKNDLQLVSGFLGMAGQTASQESRPAFETANQRVRAIAQVYDRLTQYSESERIDLRDLVGELGADAARSLDLTPDISADRVELTSSLAITIALVVNELLLNAAKHAYGPAEARPVALQARRLAGGLEILVRDRGRGLPEGVDPLQLPRPGSQIILSLVGRTGGRVMFRRLDPGLEARVLLPLD